MVLLLNTNRYHIQVDVIDANFSALVNGIRKNIDEAQAEEETPNTDEQQQKPQQQQQQQQQQADALDSTGSTSGDYLAVELAHEQFLANIVKGCFMQVS